MLPALLVRHALVLALAAAPDTVDLSFADALGLALRHSPARVQAAAARTDAGSGLARGVAGFLPSVQATFGRGRTDLGAGLPDSVRLTALEWNGSLTLNQVIFDPTAIAGLAAGITGFGSRRAEARDFESRLLYDVTADYLGLLRTGMLRDAARAALARAEENLRIAGQKERLGSASTIDVLRSEVFKSQVEIELLQSERAVAVAQAAFRATVGLDGMAVVRPTESLPGPAEAALPPAGELMAEIERLNPGLEIARRARAAADINRAAAWGRALPGVSAYWSSNWSDPDFPRRLDDWTGSDVRSWGVRASFPLLDLKTWLLGVVDATSDARRARASTRAAELQLRSTATAALLGYAEARQTFEFARRNLELSERLHELALAQHRLGNISLADFFGVEADLARARATLTGALCDTYIQAARINYLLGATDPSGLKEQP
ncbi:MAG: TolC family protein [bacterium]